MWAVHARYRGRETRRAELVQRFAGALSRLDGTGKFEILKVEELRVSVDNASTASDIVTALLAAGDWRIGIGVNPKSAENTGEHTRNDAAMAKLAAGEALGLQTKSEPVKVRIVGAADDSSYAFNIAAAFILLAQVVAKRSLQGREATALVRSGLNQNEAAEQLNISKQALSQRLQAAGWQAEQIGWRLAVNLLNQAANWPGN